MNPRNQKTLHSSHETSCCKIPPFAHSSCSSVSSLILTSSSYLKNKRHSAYFFPATMATSIVFFLQSIIILVCLCSFPTKGLAAEFKSEACVLSPSPFAHLKCDNKTKSGSDDGLPCKDCGPRYVKIQEAIYSTVCGNHGCRVPKDNIKCKPEVSQECWIMVEQIPLVECGNYYSLFLEVQYDCVKDPLDNNLTSTGMHSSSPSFHDTNSTLHEIKEIEDVDVKHNHNSEEKDEEAFHDKTQPPKAVTAIPLVTPLGSKGLSEKKNSNRDIAMTTPSRPLPTNVINMTKHKPTLASHPGKKRRPLGNSAASFTGACLQLTLCLLSFIRIHH